MSDDHAPTSTTHAREQGGDPIESLLRLAGPREAVPADRMRRVRTAVHAEWRKQTRARSRRTATWWTLGAVAAAALVVVGVRLTVRGDRAVPTSLQVLATLEATNGAVRLVAGSERAATGPILLQVGDAIRAGDGVDTTSGGVAALRLPGGASVRVDRGARLRMVSERVLVLDEGAIYVDADARAATDGLEVRTALGVARDVGTRFEVRLTGGALRVRVRDGLVRVSQSRQSYEAKPGDELTVSGDGSVARRTVPVFGTDWAWAATLAPAFELEGRSLREFLDWITNENGWQLRFADPAVEQKSLTTTLHGSIRGLTPEEALAAVLPTVGVEHQLADGVLLVALSTGTGTAGAGKD